MAIEVTLATLENKRQEKRIIQPPLLTRRIISPPPFLSLVLLRQRGAQSTNKIPPRAAEAQRDSVAGEAVSHCN